ncbi:MAG: GerW family sporulation protein [Clostridiaceae bacterium]
MEVENVVKENLDTLFQKLEKFLKTETVVGEPIVIGETTIVPLVTITFGCGTGAGGGSGSNMKSGAGSGSGSGSALCSGARITPSAVLVIQGGEVSMMPIKERSGMENLLNKIPDIMEKVNKKEKEAEGEG